MRNRAHYELKRQIPEIVDAITASYTADDPLSNVGDRPIPSRESVIRILSDVEQVIYPGYFGQLPVDRVNFKYYIGTKLNEIFEGFSEQIAKSLRHRCEGAHLVCDLCMQRGREETVRFMKRIPELRRLLRGDVTATWENDPAASSLDEIIFSYPGVKAITIYRIAHELYHQEIPVLPRIMTEYAHRVTGIDIHPGAHIGEHFFIDHGTGVVIGETCTIGDRVKIYQGVTLGALSLARDECGEVVRDTKRHPTVEDDVTIYSGATILGGDTVIGAGSIVGGNVWLTTSIPPGTKVVIEPPRQKFRDNRIAPKEPAVDFQI
ncbi:MAG: serine O-acetyltransferase EpsC [bacterium]